MAPRTNLEEQLDRELRARYDFVDLTNSNENPFKVSDDRLIGSKTPTIDIPTQRKLQEIQKFNSLLTIEEAVAIMKIYSSAIDRVLKENGEDL